MSEEVKSARQAHLEALKAERDSVAGRPESDTRARRLQEIDAQIDEYSDRPTRRRRETAAQGVGGDSSGPAVS